MVVDWPCRCRCRCVAEADAEADAVVEFADTDCRAYAATMLPGRALELAVETAEFLNGQRRDTLWARTPEPEAPTDHTLYHGTAGILLFLLELSAATGDLAYERQAVSAGNSLIDVVAKKSWASVSFATGWPGYAFALNELYKRTDDQRFADAANLCIDRLLNQAQPIGAGIGWVEPMPFSDITGFTGDREIFDVSVGAAGAALALLSLSQHSTTSKLLDSAVAIGERLLEVGEHTESGSRWGLMSDMPYPFTAPNFAHGGAGVGYLFARLNQETGEKRFLDASLEAARYVVSRLHLVGDGSLVCHTEEQQPPEFYLGQCHGPAGTARLFLLLANRTGDIKHLEPVSGMLRAIRSLGAPEQRSWGWWNNHGRCCGDAGLGDAALVFADARAGSMGDTELLGTEMQHNLIDLADRCAEVIESQSSAHNGGRSWTQAEHRSRPRFVQAQTGFMQGAAGIGSFLVHFATHGAANACGSRIVLPDDIV